MLWLDDILNKSNSIDYFILEGLYGVLYNFKLYDDSTDAYSVYTYMEFRKLIEEKSVIGVHRNKLNQNCFLLIAWRREHRYLANHIDFISTERLECRMPLVQYNLMRMSSYNKVSEDFEQYTDSPQQTYFILQNFGVDSKDVKYYTLMSVCHVLCKYLRGELSESNGVHITIQGSNISILTTNRIKTHTGYSIGDCICFNYSVLDKSCLAYLAKLKIMGG